MAKPNLNFFFPLPSPPLSTTFPRRLSGVTHETKVAVTKSLKENHIQCDGFLNEQGFHNHISHQLLAVYALGGAAPLYDAIFKTQSPLTRPSKTSSKTISKENFNEYLGDISYYEAYLQYFLGVLQKKDAGAAVEEYIFSRSANYTGDKLAGGMFNRFNSGIFHPMIFIGYGLEFGLPGLVAEGLAQTACHALAVVSLYPASEFDTIMNADPDSGSVSKMATKLSSLALNRPVATSNEYPASGPGVHAFTILSRIVKDERFSVHTLHLTPPENPAGALNHYETVAQLVGEDLVKLTEEWLPLGADLDEKIEELSWLAVLVYGVAGRKAGEAYNADFFNMHIVTSTLFLPPFVEYLSPSSTILFLRKHFVASVALWIARGRPTFNIREFYVGTSVNAASVRDMPKPSLAPVGTSPNPWFALVEHALVHPDDHIAKVQRALLHFASVYGEREPGAWAFTGLEGAEVLDGTVFVRVAQLTSERVAQLTSERKEGARWDFKGFFV